MEKLRSVKFYGVDLPVFLVFAVIVLVSCYMEIVPNQLIGAVACMFTIGILLGEIGERIPIWNTYCGGGALLAFFVCGFLSYKGLLPECVVNNANGWMNEYSFLNLFISFLIVGSLLGLDRNMLIRSSSLFLPTILAGVVGSMVFGAIGGMIFGKDPMYVITSYVLPIMGGGAGAGAIPMAQVYADVTGEDPSAYLSFALAILAVGNIVSVIYAPILNVIASVFPKLSGNGELMKRADKAVKTEEKAKIAVTMDDVGAGIFLTGAFFVLSQLMAKKILPSIMGVSIPNFAYLIILATFANIFNLIPERLKAGAQKCQQFCANKLVWIQMVGVGVAIIDFNVMLSVFSLQNLIIVILIVGGGIVGSALFGAFVGFYPVESAITAGLCMSNMGGAGDLAVLGAAKRMNLISYAQISSRIGGAMILLIASVVFTFVK
ncbi:MAG: 2-hydroxycarboxylate transporter family protein [Clostridiales bacterium]|nr:2-hydroxycarboxylate transporter family protein [Clostridiales bacterium]